MTPQPARKGPRLVVDSSDAVTQTVHDAVTRWLGMTPLYWARYLTDGGHRDATPMTRAEVQAIHKFGHGVIVIWNDVDPAALDTVVEGHAQAVLAVKDAEALGVPKGTTIFADIEETYPVTAEWLTGWVQGIEAAHYQAGMYCGAEAPDAQGALSDLRTHTPDILQHLTLWYAAWIQTGPWDHFVAQGAAHRVSLPPWPTSYPAEAAIWQFSGASAGNLIDLDLMREEGAVAAWVP